MIKKIFCLFSLLLLTGCSVNYSIIYEKNGSIKDNLTIEEGVAIFDNSKPDDWNDLFNSRIHDIKIMNEYNNEKNYYVINLNNTYLDNVSSQTFNCPYSPVIPLEVLSNTS